MNKYIKDGQILDFSFELDSKYNIGSTYEDYQNGKFVKLSDKQIAFMESNPTANIYEIWNMKIEPIVPTLEQVKREKILNIEQYDNSESVNSFTVNGNSAWFTPEIRSNYKSSIDAAEILQESNISFFINNVEISLPVTTAKTMLAQIQRYADSCFIVTTNHKSEVNKLTTIADVNSYDITLGYPDKLIFNV